MRRTGDARHFHVAVHPDPQQATELVDVVWTGPCQVVANEGQTVRIAHRVAVVHGPERVDGTADLAAQSRAQVGEGVELSLARLSARALYRREEVSIQGGRARRHRASRTLRV